MTFDPHRIRWIAFDAVDTLIRPVPSVAAVYHEVGARHGSRLERNEVATRFRHAFAHFNQEGTLSCDCSAAAQEWHTCETRERLRWRRLVDVVLDDVVSPEACFDELFAYFGQASSWWCFPEVEPTLKSLRAAGFQLAISSNFDARLNPVMEGLPPLHPISLRIISSEVGHRKPSPHFFESLLTAANCAPAEMVFVGDNPQSDVAAAESVGIPGLLIDRAARTDENRVLRSLTQIVDLMRR